MDIQKKRSIVGHGVGEEKQKQICGKYDDVLLMLNDDKKSLCVVDGSEEQRQ